MVTTIAQEARVGLLRQRLDRGARGSGVGHGREPLVGGDGDVDDRPAGRAHGQVVGGLGHRQRPGHVESLHGVPSLGGDGLGRDEVLAAGVVEQEVQPAVALQRPGDDRLSPGALADVARHPRAPLPQLVAPSRPGLPHGARR